MKKLGWLIFILCLPLLFGQDQGKKLDPFGSSSQVPQGLVPPPPAFLPETSSAKSPEPIPEYLLWGRFRSYVKLEGDDKSLSPYKETIHAILGSKVSAIAELARKSSQQLVEANEKHHQAFQEALARNVEDKERLKDLGNRAYEAGKEINEHFKKDVLKLLSEEERAQLEQFLTDEMAKGIKVSKLPKE